jgi:hypothetical protein
MTRTDPNPLRDRVCQGDILRNVEYFESFLEQGGILEVGKVLFPLAIVLTQDCDLEGTRNTRQVAHLCFACADVQRSALSGWRAPVRPSD